MKFCIHLYHSLSASTTAHQKNFPDFKQPTLPSTGRPGNIARAERQWRAEALADIREFQVMLVGSSCRVFILGTIMAMFFETALGIAGIADRSKTLTTVMPQCPGNKYNSQRWISVAPYVLDAYPSINEHFRWSPWGVAIVCPHLY